MTLKQMREAALRRLGSSAYLSGSADPGIIADSELDAEINMAALDVALKLYRAKAVLRPKSVDFSTVVDQQEYPLYGTGSTVIVTDNDFLGLILVELLVTSTDPSTFINCDLLDGGAVQRKNFRRRWGDDDNQSPSIYLRGQNLGFIDVPTSVRSFRLHYAPRPKVLLPGEENSEKLADYIPEEYHEVVVQTAVVEVYGAEASPSAERARAKKHELVEQMFATANDRQRQKVHYKQSRRL